MLKVSSPLAGGYTATLAPRTHHERHTAVQHSFSKDKIAVIGASGRSGSALCRSLLAQNCQIIAVVRDPTKLAPDIAQRCYAIKQANLTDPQSLACALKEATLVVNTAHARHCAALLAATPAPLVALGSTRKFTRWPDAHGQGVLAGEAALQQDGRPSVILHPTMIYGAQGENNVQRLAALLKKLPIIPLPQGGRFLVQPIDQRDVTRSLVAALTLLSTHRITSPQSIVIAGLEAVSYKKFIDLILHYSGIKKRPIISVPSSVLCMAAGVLRYIPRFPRIEAAEIRRLTEDKNFDITAMQQQLGVTPHALTQGLEHLLRKQP